MFYGQVSETIILQTMYQALKSIDPWSWRELTPLTPDFHRGQLLRGR